MKLAELKEMCEKNGVLATLWHDLALTAIKLRESQDLAVLKIQQKEFNLEDKAKLDTLIKLFDRLKNKLIEEIEKKGNDVLSFDVPEIIELYV